MTTELPADVIGRAAKLMRKRAKEATPGPWERPLDVRQKNVVIAALPGDEDSYRWEAGIIPAKYASHGGLTGRYAGQRERCAVVSADSSTIDGFRRKRSGRDLDFIASMHPGVALAVADWLDKIAWMLTLDDDLAGRTGCDEALAVARAYLGEEDRS